MKKLTKKGFTLIELMIVIAIIAILAAILVPNFANARKQAQFAACKGNLKNIGTGMEVFYSIQNNYPEATGATGVESQLQSNKSLGNMPWCPLTKDKSVGNKYSCSYSTAYDRQSYFIFCSGDTRVGSHNDGTGNVNKDYPQYSNHQGLLGIPSDGIASTAE